MGWRHSRRSLDGRVVAITGGARGIGLATAEAFLAEGARVAIGDIDPEALDLARRKVPARTYLLDVTSEQSFAAFLDNVDVDLGPLDILINNAGVMPVGPLSSYTDEFCRSVIDIDLDGVIRGSRLAAIRMVRRRSGHIVNIASVAGRVAAPGLTLYSAAKFGVVGFTEALGAELARHDVAVSVVLPSFTDTGLIDGLRHNALTPPATASDVAVTVLDIARTRRPFAVSPGRLSAPSAIAAAIPARLKRWLISQPKYARQFLEPDDTQRSSYNHRISATASVPATSSRTPHQLERHGDSEVWDLSGDPIE